MIEPSIEMLWGVIKGPLVIPEEHDEILNERGREFIDKQLKKGILSGPLLTNIKTSDGENITYGGSWWINDLDLESTNNELRCRIEVLESELEDAQEEIDYLKEECSRLQ